MISVVCWLWASPDNRFTWDHVAALRAQVKKHYRHPFRFICVTNVTGGATGVEQIYDTADFLDIPSPHGPAYPSCYRRLRMFHPDIGVVLGTRFVSLDLDVVLTADPTPLWHREEQIVLLKDSGGRGGYNGSMVLMTAGTRPNVWNWFDGMASQQQALVSGRFGSDQGWISHVLGDGEATWTAADGVYSWRNELQKNGGKLPPDARMVVFHGAFKPWHRAERGMEWIANAYSSQ